MLEHDLLEFWVFGRRDFGRDDAVDVFGSTEIILGDFIQEKYDVSMGKTAFLKFDDSNMGNDGSKYFLVDDQGHEVFHFETKHTCAQIRSILRRLVGQ